MDLPTAGSGLVAVEPAIIVALVSGVFTLCGLVITAAVGIYQFRKTREDRLAETARQAKVDDAADASARAEAEAGRITLAQDLLVNHVNYLEETVTALRGEVAELGRSLSRCRSRTGRLERQVIALGGEPV